MQTVKSIIGEIKNTHELKGLIEVYEELAADKMQEVREEILSVREFYDKLGQLSETVGSDFEHIPSSTGTNTAVIFIAANTGLYGDIVDKTFRLFVDFVKKNKSDIYVLGKMGGEMIKQIGLEVPFHYLSLADDTVDENTVNQLIRSLLTYKKVVLFYGKFRNIAIQTAVATTVSGELIPKSPALLKELAKKRFQYLYEPSLFDVSDIFANEIMGSVIEQTIRESQLSKFASRLMHLDAAVTNIHRKLERLDGQKRSIIKDSTNKKQNALITGIMVRGL